MDARRVTALGGAALLVLLAGCALLQQGPVARVRFCCDSPACFTFAFSGFDPDGTVLLVEWDFGDGETAQGMKVAHVYTRTGDYRVTATVCDEDGLSDTASVSLHASREIPVAPGGSIQAAIDSSADGETVMLAPATYYERIDFKGKAITVRSALLESPATIAQRPILWPDSTGPVVSFVSGEGRDSILQGVIVHGRGDDYSGIGVTAHESSPTLDGCTVEGFTAVYGAGATFTDSNALVRGCTVQNCRAFLNGGGVYAWGLTQFPEFLDCVVRWNVAGIGGGMYFSAAADGYLAPGAILPIIHRCTFVENQATGNPEAHFTISGGGVHVGMGVRVDEADNVWQSNYPYDIRYDL